MDLDRHSVLGWHARQDVGGIELVEVAILGEFRLDLRYLGLEMLDNAAGDVGVIVVRAEAGTIGFGGEAL